MLEKTLGVDRTPENFFRLAKDELNTEDLEALERGLPNLLQHVSNIQDVYSLPVACRYLIPPAISAEQYIKTMKPSDLPTAFQQSFWDAALKRQKWEENAGQLWRTEKVREVLGSTFQTIKFTMQLWADTLERQTGLSQEQRTLLTKMVDGLQEEIYKALVSQAANGRTSSQRGEIHEMIGEPTQPVVEEDADDWQDLV